MSETFTRVVAAVRDGRTKVAPANRRKCEYCDFGDVCRVGATQAAGEAEGA